MCDQSKIAESMVQPEQNTTLSKTPFLLESLSRHLRTPLYANAYYLMANTAVNSLSGFVFWAMAARLYTADDVGIASTIISSALFLSSLSSLGLGVGLIRFLPGAGEASDCMLDSSLTFLAIVSLIAAIIFLAGLPLWSPALAFMHGESYILIAFALLVPLLTLTSITGQVFIAHRAAKFTLICTAILSALKILLPVLISVLGSFSLVVSIGIAAVVSLGVALIWLLPSVQDGYLPHPRLHTKILRDLVPYSVGNHLAALLAQTPQVILPIIVLNVLGPEESAYSYVAWMLANVLFMISGAVSTSVFAEGSNEKACFRANIKRAWTLILLLSAPAVLLTLVIGDRLLLLFGSEYADKGANLLAILAVSAIPASVNNLYFAAKRVSKETGIILLLSTFIASGTLGLSYLLMPRHGITGNGIAWLASQGAVAGIVMWSIFSKRRKTPSARHHN
jgi:O-antigen/teichoic acid export membrane protein